MRKTMAQHSGASGRKLYSVPVWLQERIFIGEFEIGGKTYNLTFAPSHAEIVDKQLQLRGPIAVNDHHATGDAQATLAAIQGGIGSGPMPYKMMATGAPKGQEQSPTEKQQKAGETEKKPGEPVVSDRHLPPTESTGITAFTAVMYFQMGALDQRTLGVPADMSHVQLNARLAPRDPVAHNLHSLYSALTHALAGERADTGAAASLVRELNQVLAG